MPPFLGGLLKCIWNRPMIVNDGEGEKSYSSNLNTSH